MAESSYPEEHIGENADLVFVGLPQVYVSKGSHIAHFYRGDQERFTVLIPFLKAGLEAGDQCLVIAEPPTSPIIRGRLQEMGVDVEKALASGQLLVSEGGYDVEEMASVCESAFSQALSAGREVVRLGADMLWALHKMPVAEKLLEWEAFSDRSVGSRYRSSFVVLCQYDHSRFNGSALMYALQTHPLSIISSVVHENPFHRDPEEILREVSQSAA